MTLNYNPSTNQSSYFSLGIPSKDFNMAFENTMIIINRNPASNDPHYDTL